MYECILVSTPEASKTAKSGCALTPPDVVIRNSYTKNKRMPRFGWLQRAPLYTQGSVIDKLYHLVVLARHKTIAPNCMTPAVVQKNKFKEGSTILYKRLLAPVSK